MPASRASTSANISAETTAITTPSRTVPRAASTSSTAGAISDDSASRASRGQPTSTGRSGRGSVSPAIEGCSAAAPHAAYSTIQPRSVGPPTCQEPPSWRRPYSTSETSSPAVPIASSATAGLRRAVLTTWMTSASSSTSVSG